MRMDFVINNIEYTIINGKVIRKSDKYLAVLVSPVTGHPWDNERRFDPDVVRYVLSGNTCKLENIYLEITWVPLNSYYKITLDTYHGDESIEIFNSVEWLSFGS